MKLVQKEEDASGGDDRIVWYIYTVSQTEFHGRNLDLGFLELSQTLSEDVEHVLANEVHVVERLIEGLRGRGTCREGEESGLDFKVQFQCPARTDGSRSSVNGVQKAHKTYPWFERASE